MAQPIKGRHRGSLVEGIDVAALSEPKMMELAIFILQKPIVDRHNKEIELLRKYTENIKCFQDVIENLGIEAHADMCQKMGYKALDAGVTLFEVGSIGYEFYMILKGRVEVWIKINKGYKPDGTADFEMKKVAELETGKSFGELAIMDETIKPRAATIIAKEDCIFGVLDRKTYKSILGKYHRLETFAKINFLAEMPIYHGWTFHEIKSWVYLFEFKTKHKRKTVIYKEGDAADMIYVVKSGEVKVTKVVDLKYKPGEAEELMLDDTKSLLVFEKDPIKKAVEIVTITPGHMFGEEEAWAAYKMDQEMVKWAIVEDKQTKAKRKESTFSDTDSEASSAAKKDDSPEKKEEPKKRFKMPTRLTTVTVHSFEAEIWAIPRKNFFAKLSQSVQSVKALLEIITTKKEFREMRISEIQNQVAGHINIIRGNPKYDNEDLQMKITAKKYLQNGKKEEIIYKGDTRYMDYITGGKETESPRNSTHNFNVTSYNTTLYSKPNLTTQVTMEPFTRPISPTKAQGGVKYYDLPDFNSLKQHSTLNNVDSPDPSAHRTQLENQPSWVGSPQNSISHHQSIATYYNASPLSTIARETLREQPQTIQPRDLSIPIPKEVLLVDHPLNSNNDDPRLTMISSAKPKMVVKGSDDYITEKIADKMKVYHKLQNYENAHKTSPHFFKMLQEPRDKHVDLTKYAVNLPTISDKPERDKAYDRDYIRKLNQREDESELYFLSPFQKNALVSKTRYQSPMTANTNNRSNSFDIKVESRKDSLSRETLQTTLPKPTITGFKTTTDKFKNYYGGSITPNYRPATIQGTPKSNRRYHGRDAYQRDSDVFVPVGIQTPGQLDKSTEEISPNVKVTLSPPISPDKFLEQAKNQIKKSMGYAPALPVPRPPKRSASADPPVNIHMQKLTDGGSTLYGFVRRKKKKLLEIEGKNMNMGQYIVKYRTKVGKERAMITDMSLIEYSAEERKKTEEIKVDQSAIV